ncbi:MAG: hypothetical protein Q7R59_01120 [bacterium]|nr:hypothetical protein [bacterium]
MHSFVCLKDGGLVRKARNTMKAAAEGKKVSKKRLQETQDFLLELLEEINAKRPKTPVRRGGNADGTRTRSQLAADIAESR